MLTKQEADIMVFTRDKESKQLIARIHSQNGVEKFSCSLSACENPTCLCGEVNIDFSPVHKGSADHKTTPHTVVLDVEHREIINEKISKKDLYFAESVITQMEEEDFQLLHKLHFIFKNTITENAKIEDIDGLFDYQEIEMDGFMPAYNDVLPFGDQLQVTIHEEKYLVLDQYCLLPKCSCSEPVLVLIPMDNLGKNEDEFCAITVNYRKRQWKRFDAMSSGLTRQSLRSEIEGQIQNFQGRLAKRHAKLKAIYKNCRKEFMEPRQLVSREKVGRNAPCPCGSGKKYKKCCMRKDGA
jgi:hypothetical protein